jgi:uncharacterized membrane protein
MLDLAQRVHRRLTAGKTLQLKPLRYYDAFKQFLRKPSVRNRPYSRLGPLNRKEARRLLETPVLNNKTYSFHKSSVIKHERLFGRT